MSKDEAPTTAQNEVAKDSNKRSAGREEHPIEALPDAKGNVAEIDRSKYPEGSPAAKGTATPPSGQGGAMPKSRPDYQDAWPPNPPPDEATQAWAAKIEEVGAVQAHSDAANEEAGRTSGKVK